MKWKHVQSFLSVWHKRLLSATLDMHDIQENVRQSNLLLAFLQTISLKASDVFQILVTKSYRDLLKDCLNNIRQRYFLGLLKAGP